MTRLLLIPAITIMVCAFGVLTPASAQSVRVIGRPAPSIGEPSAEMLIKRMPEGGEFLLTVNKDQDVSHFTIRWFKDGALLKGETAQFLRYPIAVQEHAGVYTVELSGPCASVMSRPIQVLVEDRSYVVQTEVGGDAVAGKPTRSSLHEVGDGGFQLLECQPNPVTDQATISFITEAVAPIVVKVVDLNGAVVATLVNDVLPAGEHSVTINTREHNMQSSLYYYVLTAPGFTATKPMMLVK